MRVEPPASVPMASGTRPAATAATAPPLDPPGKSELGRCGLAENDCTLSAQTFDADVVTIGHEALQHQTAPLRRQPGDIKVVLDHHRDAIERTETPTGLLPVGRSLRRGCGAGAIEQREWIERGPQAVATLQVHLQQLDRRGPAGIKQRGKSSRILAPELGVCRGGHVLVRLTGSRM